MKLIPVLVVLVALMIPVQAHAELSESYAYCRRACSLNGLTCVFKCLASGAGTTTRTPPQSQQVLSVWANSTNVAIFENGTTTTSPAYRTMPVKPKGSSLSVNRSTARNFAPSRPYNSGQSGRN